MTSPNGLCRARRASGRSAGGGWGKSRPAVSSRDDPPALPAERGTRPAAEHRPDARRAIVPVAPSVDGGPSGG